MESYQRLPVEDAPQAEEAPEAADEQRGARNPFPIAEEPAGEDFDPAREQYAGLVLGIALGSYRMHDGSDRFLVLPGDDVKITLPDRRHAAQGRSATTFTIVDFYESKMSEYDSNFVFVPIAKLQEMRGMIDPTTGIGNVTSIQIKLQAGRRRRHGARQAASGLSARDLRRSHLARQAGPAAGRRADGNGHAQRAVVHDHRRGRLRHPGDLLHDRRREDPRHRHSQVAGRAEPRHHGHLPRPTACRWASSASGVGMAIGLAVRRATSTRSPTAWAGSPARRCSIRRSITSNKIPTIVEPFTVVWIVAGAMVIAVLASILPARRAARLHPVEALRYE